MKTSLLVTASLAGALFGASLAHAQSAAHAPQPSGGVEEIVVTAQKRSENVQTVPIAVTAFTANTLIEKNVTAVQGLSNLTPNVTLDAGSPFSGSTSVLTAYIRGIGQDDFAFNLDPGVGVYVDGIYLARTVGANTDLLDVDRIEVLKGPQGTLFGRNSVGGAISIVTRTPGNEFTGRAEATTGSYNRLDVRGTVDVPLVSDTLLSTITFSESRRDGYLHRLPFPGSYITDPLTAVPRSGYDTNVTEGGENQWAVRGKLLWKAGPRLRVTLTGDYQRVDQPGTASTLLRVLANDGGPPTYPGELFGSAYNLCVGVPNNLLPAAPGGNIRALCGKTGTGGVILGLPNAPNAARLHFNNQFLTKNIDTSYATGPDFSKLSNWGIGGTIDVDLADNLLLKSITGYRQLQWSAATDSDGSPITIIEPGFILNQEQVSEELQLIGKAFDRRLSYLVGLYAFKEDGLLHDFVPFGGGLLQVDGRNYFTTNSYAAFTHLNFKLTEKLSVTAGGRYTHEEKKFEGFQRDPNGFLYKLVFGAQLDQITPALSAALGFPDSSDPLRFYPPGVNRKTFDNFSPKLGVEYKPFRDTLVYGSYSEGYKTGGWTTRLSAPVPKAPDFNEEKAYSYEIGIKNELFDRHLRLNLAGFYTTYKGIQLTQTTGISPTTRNAGDAEIYGMEAEYQAVITDDFQISGSIGHIHDRYIRKDAGTTAGNKLPKTPSWKVNISPRYTVHLSERGRVIANVDYTYTSSLFNNTENTPELERKATSIVSASLTYHEPRDRWTFAVGGVNLTDERYLTTGQFQPGGGLIYGTYNRPAEWYAQLGFRF